MSSTTPAPGGAHRTLDRAGVELRVGARGDRDLVLAGRVDGDQRDAGRRVHARDRAVVDPLALEQLERLVADGSAPTAPIIAHPRAEPRRGDGLVGALAAAVAGEAPARDGLAGRGQPLGDHDEVGVDRADDDDLCPPGLFTRAAYADPATAGRRAAARRRPEPDRQARRLR